MSTTVPSASLDALDTGPDPKRWLALCVIAIAQLMIVVDASIVNIALPSAQTSLHISNADRQWIITAYTLAFGGLLLLGGRIADYVGRKRIFTIGLLGFAIASAVGGLATDAAMLFAARAVQGAFAAAMAPAALSILSVTFTDEHERNRAFGVFGSIAGGGAAIGLILGGVLTQFASWRWCLLVNAPIAAAAALAATRVVRESRAEGRTRYDLPGAITSTAGLVALVYAVTKATTDGWSSSTVVEFLAVAAVLLVAFVVIELRSAHPLLPMRVILERNRGSAFLTSFLVGGGMFGMFVLLTYYLQGTLHYSALKSGFAFVPFSVGIIVSATVAGSLISRVGVRSLWITGLVMSIVGLIIFSQIGTHPAYWSIVFPAEIVMSLGMGLVFVPMTSVALFGVGDADAGVASAMVNTSQQVGGSIGTALLNTIATTATGGYLAAHGTSALVKGTVHGYNVAFYWAVAFVAVALVLTVLLLRARAQDLAHADTPVMV